MLLRGGPCIIVRKCQENLASWPAIGRFKAKEGKGTRQRGEEVMGQVVRVFQCIALGLILLTIPLTGGASGKTLALTDLVVSATSEGLVFYCTLEGGFPEDVVGSIQSGILVTLRYVAELRRRRGLWRDETVSTAEVRHAIKCDILKKECSLLADNCGHISTRITKEFAELERWVTEVHGARVAEPAQLEEGERYYVRAKAELESFHPPFPLRYLYSLFSLFRIGGDWAATSTFTVRK